MSIDSLDAPGLDHQNFRAGENPYAQLQSAEQNSARNFYWELAQQASELARARADTVTPEATRLIGLIMDRAATAPDHELGDADSLEAQQEIRGAVAASLIRATRLCSEADRYKDGQADVLPLYDMLGMDQDRAHAVLDELDLIFGAAPGTEQPIPGVELAVGATQKNPQAIRALGLRFTGHHADTEVSPVLTSTELSQTAHDLPDLTYTPTELNQRAIDHAITRGRPATDEGAPLNWHPAVERDPNYIPTAGHKLVERRRPQPEESANDASRLYRDLEYHLDTMKTGVAQNDHNLAILRDRLTERAEQLDHDPHPRFLDDPSRHAAASFEAAMREAAIFIAPLPREQLRPEVPLFAGEGTMEDPDIHLIGDEIIYALGAHAAKWTHRNFADGRISSNVMRTQIPGIRVRFDHFEFFGNEAGRHGGKRQDEFHIALVRDSPDSPQ